MPGRSVFIKASLGAGLFLAAGLLLLAPGVASAQGFPGFEAQVHGDVYGQPKIIEDFDGDGKKDIIFGATDGKVHIFSSTGREIFRPPYWPKQTGGPILAEVQLADLDNDGGSEIVVASQDGKVYCLNALGREKWVLDTRGKILVSAPEIADVDGSGERNVFVGSKSGTVSRVDASGHLLWEVRMNSSVSAAVVARDLNGNGVKEIICKDDSGKVMILNETGAQARGWPQDTAANMTWPFNVDAGDIDGDGIKEIYTTTPDKKFIMWDSEGKKLSEFPLTDGAHTAPRLADLDGDGHDEFIIGQADGTITVCDKNGSPRPGWPFITGHAIYHVPRILDIDGDGRPDLVFTAWNPKGTAEKAGYVMALSRNGQPLAGFPKYIGKTVAPLAFADLDSDGYLEMIAVGGINYTGKQLHVFPTRARNSIRVAVLGQEINFQ
ncbi:MAG TPA: FG-GAP-like repeat-containing protein [Candidatus Rifleibacterium sp.]|nr:FG-GAP-like repeat-containing protein [Candidatus Rifleibacterium sp.]HPT45156.1 FG-GAP-like repeat-containing protein [Candidatus Rifleibacterium sp.]